MQTASPIFRKQSESEEGVVRLTNEAAILRSAAHPNIVELLGSTITNGKASLRIAEINAIPLAETALPLQDYGRVIMSAAVTLGHLHRHNVAHNNINPTHILVRASDKSAVLCGFGGATFTEDNYTQTKDVIALASLLRDHVTAQNDPLRARINGVVGDRAELALSLRSIAEIAADGETTALALADTLRQVLENAPVLRAPAQRKFHRLPWKVAAIVIIPLALLGVGLSLLSGKSDKAAATPTTLRPSVINSCDALAKNAMPVDIDGDGCPNAVTFGSGLVTVDGQRYAVGTPTDQMIIGDWQGTNLATLALLRVSTGEVFVFNTWPSAGKTVIPTPIATVPGAVSFQAKRQGQHDVLIVATTLNGDITVDPNPGIK